MQHCCFVIQAPPGVDEPDIIAAVQVEESPEGSSREANRAL